MPNVVTNAAKLQMINSISGSDLNIALLNNIVLSATSTLESLGSWSSSLSAYEISGTGYIAGGVSLSGISTSIIPDTAYFNGSSVIWPITSLSAYGYALYKTTTGLVISIVTFNGVSEGSPKISQSGPFAISWNSNQILQMIG